jgi:hypothetical protein
MSRGEGHDRPAAPDRDGTAAQAADITFGRPYTSGRQPGCPRWVHVAPAGICASQW